MTVWVDEVGMAGKDWTNSRILVTAIDFKQKRLQSQPMTEQLQ